MECNGIEKLVESDSGCLAKVLPTGCWASQVHNQRSARGFCREHGSLPLGFGGRSFGRRRRSGRSVPELSVQRKMENLCCHVAPSVHS